MTESGGQSPAAGGSKKSSGSKPEIVQGFVEGMSEMMDKSGLGALREVPDTISTLFGAEGNGGGGHRK